VTRESNPYLRGPWAPVILDPTRPETVMHRDRGLLISPDGLKPASLQIAPEDIFDLVTPTIRDLDFKVTSGTKLRDMVELERDRWKEARTARLPYGLYAHFADKGHLVHYPPPSLWEAAQTISSATLYRDFGLEGAFEDMRALVRREVPAVAGCSVGRRIAEGLFCYHFGHMKLADKKCGHPAGNNRAPHTYEEMTRHDSKAVSLARRLYAEDGLAALSVYRDGVHGGNIDDFVSGNPDVAEPPATIVFEETDDLLTKLDLRVACRLARVPYAMITDLGRWSLVDFYDFSRTAELPLVAGTPDARTLQLALALREDPDNVFLKRTITMALVGGTEVLRGELRNILTGENQRAGDQPRFSDPPQDGSTCLFGGVVAPRLLLQKLAGCATSGRRLLDPLGGEVFRQDW
jgi:hypothetical protein